MLFDQIGVIHNQEHSNYLTDDPDIVEYLNQQEIIFLLDLDQVEIYIDRLSKKLNKLFEGQDITEFVENPEKYPDLSESINYANLFSSIYADMGVDSINYRFSGNQKILQEFESKNDYLQKVLLRLVCAVFEENTGKRTFPILPFSTKYDPNKSITKHTVVSLLLNKLPLPDDETPWEQILEFKNDPNSKQNLINLRRWVRKITSERIPVNELEEEYLYLINEFSRYYQLNRAKANLSTIETILNVPLEVVEYLPFIKFSKLKDPLFVFGKRKMALLEAELSAPGKELSYIIKAKEFFEN